MLWVKRKRKVNLKLHENIVEYFNLTEIGTLDEDSRDDLVRSWMRNRLTLESLIVWEQMFNPNFKGDDTDTFRKEAGLNSFNLTPKKWIKSTNAVGIISKAGRYGGGTFAHRHYSYLNLPKSTQYTAGVTFTHV